MTRYPVAKIDLAALRHNFLRIKQLAPHSRVMSVIKADAYGHGVVAVAETLADSDAFAVARIDEAVQLRKAGFSQSIVILEGANTAEEFHLAAAHKLSPLFHLPQQVELLLSLTLATPLAFNWLMVDSGMHRLGIRPAQVKQTLEALERSDNIEGNVALLSHFANADLVADERNDEQLKKMLTLKQQTQRPLCLANSAAVISLADARQDWVRPGLMLYGLSPFNDRYAADVALKPVMKLMTALIAVYDLQAGEQVGYGGDWTASQPCRIGVASIGYGDGYSRHLSNKGMVIIHGKRVPVIGRVSMDTICILLDAVPEAGVGDDVILWGTHDLPVEELAALAGTIPYELVTVLCRRVSRETIDG